jgi:hypothetical protein
MAVLDSKDVHKSLLKKGFVESNSHHKMYEYYYDGKFILHTHASHNGQDIDDYLIAKMKSQCKLDKKQFIDLIKCPLTKERYIEILKENKIID